MAAGVSNDSTCASASCSIRTVPAYHGEGGLLRPGSILGMLQKHCGDGYAAETIRDWTGRAAELLPAKLTPKTVVFFGDSTVRNLHLFFALLLRNATTLPISGQPKRFETFGIRGMLRGTILSIVLVTNHMRHFNVERASEHLAALRLPQAPDAVVLSSTGLHLFHLEPAREWTSGAAAAFRSLEERITKGIRGVQQRLPETRILYLTSNSVCESRFRGSYRRALAHPEATQAACLQRLSSFKGSNEWNRSAMCADATMTRHGAALLNRRERRVLQQFEPSVQVVDAFAQTDGQCWATLIGDGRHFAPLLPFRLNALLARLFDDVG